MRIVFMGTPDFAVPSLEGLISAGHEVCGVFCQPDKPVGRHQNKLQPPAVKVCAQSHNIPVFQPTKLRDGTALAQLQELNPELIVVAAYGRILPDDILALPPKGCINVHSSLLPKYRGSAPIHWAVVNGDKETGVTIMHMATELDAGDIITQAETAIDPAGQTVFISHGDCEEDANKVAEDVKRRFGVQTVVLNNVGPVIGAHSGPGTVALFFLGRHR